VYTSYKHISNTSSVYDVLMYAVSLRCSQFWEAASITCNFKQTSDIANIFTSYYDELRCLVPDSFCLVSGKFSPDANIFHKGHSSRSDSIDLIWSVTGHLSHLTTSRFDSTYRPVPVGENTTVSQPMTLFTARLRIGKSAPNTCNQDNLVYMFFIRCRRQDREIRYRWSFQR
jgi:hypothetical protein